MMEQHEPSFSVPILADDEIQFAMANGIIGEGAKLLTVESLKNANQNLMMQLATSILSQAGVNLQSIAEPFIDSSDELYPSETMLPFVAVKALQTLIPRLNRELTNIKYIKSPTWKKTKTFLSAAINFFRSRQFHSNWFTKIDKSRDQLAENEELVKQYENLQSDLKEVVTHLEENKALYDAQEEELKKENEQIQITKNATLDQKEKEKLAAKSACLEVEQQVSARKGELDEAQEEIARQQLMVVSSPSKILKKCDELKKQLNSAKEDCEETNDEIAELSRKTALVEEAIEFGEYCSKQSSAANAALDSIIEQQRDAIREELKINSKATDVSKLNYKIDNLKKQIQDSKDQIQRGKMRMHQLNELFKKQNNDIQKEVETLTNKYHKNDAEIAHISKEIKDLEGKLLADQVNQEKVTELYNKKVDFLFQELADVKTESRACVKEMFDVSDII